MAAAAPRRRGTVLILIGLAAIGPLSTDMYLPSLPGLTDTFHTDVPTVQLTLSLYLVGFALAQLFYGPVSDRFGRRPALLGGMALFVLASLWCAFATSIHGLIIARVLQSFGSSSGPVLSRAMARDLFPRDQVARVLSGISSAVALGPAVAPLIGGYLAVHFGWPANFLVLGSIGALLIGLVIARLEESNRTLDPTAIQPYRMIANYATMLGNRQFLSYLMAIGVGFAGLFCFVSGSSFVLIGVYHLSPEQFGHYFWVLPLGFMAGSALGVRLARLGVDRLVMAGLILSSAGGIAMIVIAMLEPGLGWGPIGVVAPVWLCTLGMGMYLSNGVAGAIGPFPHMAGAASGLMGFFQMTAGAIAGIGVAAAFDGTGVPMALGIGGLSVAALIGFVWLKRGNADQTERAGRG